MTEHQANGVKVALSAILVPVVWALSKFGILGLVTLPERLSHAALVLAFLAVLISGLYFRQVPGKKMVLLFLGGLGLSLFYYYQESQWVVETNCQAAEAPVLYVDPGYVPESVRSIVAPHVTLADAWCDADGKEEVWRAVAKAAGTRELLLIILLFAANFALVYPILFSAWRIQLRES
jgi:hypothetical protein